MFLLLSVIPFVLLGLFEFLLEALEGVAEVDVAAFLFMVFMFVFVLFFLFVLEGDVVDLGSGDVAWVIRVDFLVMAMLLEVIEFDFDVDRERRQSRKKVIGDPFLQGFVSVRGADDDEDVPRRLLDPVMEEDGLRGGEIDEVRIGLIELGEVLKMLAGVLADDEVVEADDLDGDHVEKYLLESLKYSTRAKLCASKLRQTSIFERIDVDGDPHTAFPGVGVEELF